MEVKRDMDFFTYLLGLINIFYSISMLGLPLISGAYVLGELGGGLETVNYGVTLFAVGSLSTKPLAKALVNSIGWKRTLSISMYGTLVMQLLILLSPTYTWFLVFRYIGGVFCGPLFLLFTFLITDKYAEEKLYAFNIIRVSIILVAPIFAALSAGVMCYYMSWRIPYGLNVILCGLLTLVTIPVFKAVQMEEKRDPFDWVGFLSFFLGFSSLGFCLVTGQVIDWFLAPVFTIFLVFGVVCFTFSILWSLKHPYPILEFRLLKRLGFTLVNIFVFFMYVVYLSSAVLLGFWVSLYAVFSVFWVILLGECILLGPVLALVSQKEMEHRKVLPLFALSFAIIAFACFYTSNFNVNINLLRICASRLVVAIAVAISLPPTVKLLVSSVKKEEKKDAFLFYGMFRYLGALIGVSFGTTLYETRQAFYHQRMGGELTPFSNLTQGFFEKLKIFNLSPMQKLGELNNALDLQTNVLSLNDTFFFTGWTITSVLIITILLIIYNRATGFKITRQYNK